MNKKEIISHIGKPILNPLGTLQLMAVLGIFASPFLWIWIDFIFAIKVLISSVLLVIIITKAYKFIEKCISETIDEELKKEIPKGNKSKFQQRLDEVMEQQKQAKEQ